MCLYEKQGFFDDFIFRISFWTFFTILSSIYVLSFSQEDQGYVVILVSL